MNLRLSLLAASLIALSIANPAFAQAKKAAPAAATGAKPVAVVNGSPINSGMADLLVREQLAQGQQDGPQLRADVREELIKRELLAQEGRRQGLDKNEEVQARIDIARQSIILGLYLDGYMKAHPISDETKRAEYDRQIKLAGGTEFKARHILLKTEEEAAAVITKLNAGGKFEALAADSIDPGSKEAGGDLGWARSGSYVENFKKALETLEKGTYTKQPVKTDFGYHVILLEDTRKADLPPYEAVQERITQKLSQDVIQRHIAELMGKAKIQ